MAGENGSIDNKILEQTKLFRAARPEDFDHIPDMEYFKKIAEEAYNDLVEKETLYLLNEGDKIGSFNIKEQFQNQGAQGTLFTATAWRDSPLFIKGETCLIKGIKSPPLIIEKKDYETVMRNFAQTYRSFYNERRILYFLRKKHKPCEENHLVQMLECNLDPSGGKPYMAIKLVQKKDILPAPPYKGISPQQALIIIHDLAHALKKLTEEKVIHGDVKKDNIIIDLEGRATLIDLGCGVYVDKDPDYAHASHTPTNASPEYAELILKNEKILKTSKYDLYSLGTTLHELITGENALTRTDSKFGTIENPKTWIEKIYETIASQKNPFNIDELARNSIIACMDREIFAEINTWIKNMTEPNPIKRIDALTLYHEIRHYISTSTELKQILQNGKENSPKDCEHAERTPSGSTRIQRFDENKKEYTPDEQDEEIKKKIKKGYF